MYVAAGSRRKLLAEICIEGINLARLQLLQRPLAEHGHDVLQQPASVALESVLADSLPVFVAWGPDAQPVFDPGADRQLVGVDMLAGVAGVE